MICLNCGQELDNTTSVCPYCGNIIQAVDDSEYFEEELHPIYVEGGYQEGYAESESYAQEQDYEEHEYEEEFVDDDPVYGKKSKGFGKKFSMPHVSKPNISMPKVSMPRASGLPVSTILSVICCLISLFCLISIKGVHKELQDSNLKLNSTMSSVYASVASLDERLANMDSTIAGVQDQAYNQLASQSIVISKDITALTGPVTEGKYNIMFIINAKGNLSLNSSFDWQKYNEATGGWVSLVFTGNATSNEQYGLRLENTYDNEKQHYVSTLWANGITKTSAEATVQVAAN